MARYEISRQYVNAGPTSQVYVETQAEANRVFDEALAEGAIFAEVYDMENEAQVRVEYPQIAWV